MFLAGKLLFVGSDTFVVGCIVLVTMRTGKKRVEKREREFFEIQKTTRAHALQRITYC